MVQAIHIMMMRTKAHKFILADVEVHDQLPTDRVQVFWKVIIAVFNYLKF